MLPDDDEIAAADVVTVAQEVRRLELSLCENALAAEAQDVIREGNPALEDPIAETSCALGENLAHIQLISWCEGDG